MVHQFVYRSALILCILMFLGQAVVEIGKYFQGHSSIAISFQSQARIRYPLIVLCHKEGYKNTKKIHTLDDYKSSSFNYSDLIDFSMSQYYNRDKSKLKEIYTIFYGICVYFQLDDDFIVKDFFGVGLNYYKDILVALIDYDQLQCIIYSVCSRGCSEGDEYEKCIYRKQKKIYTSEFNCSAPYAYNYDWYYQLRSCEEKDNFDVENFALKMNLVIGQNNGSDDDLCLPPCVTWHYDDAMINPVGANALASILRLNVSKAMSFHMRMATNVLTVHEEYQVMDFFALVASLGGSVGLLLGYSCYDSIKSLLDIIKGRMAQYNVP